MPVVATEVLTALVPTSTPEAAEVAHMTLEVAVSANTMAAVASDEAVATAIDAKEAKKQGHRNSRHGSVSHLFPVLLVFSSELLSPESVLITCDE